MKFQHPFLIGVILLFSYNLSAQCPVNEADLANGGTFSGDCTVDVGGLITVTGTIIWTSGRLTINDTGGGGDGDMVIVSPGEVIIQNGATLDMDDGDISINIGGTLTVNSGGSVEILDDNRELYVSGGTLNVSGNLDVEVDIEVDNGSTVNINSGANVNAGDDFTVSEGSSVQMQNGSTVTTGDEFRVDDSNVTVAGALSSTGVSDLLVSGTSVLTFENGSDVTFNDIEFGTGDGITQVVVNGGNIGLNGEVDFNNGTDGDAIIVNGGVLEVGNDIELGTTNGTITINSGGTVIAPSIDSDTYSDVNDLPSNIIINGTGILLLDGVPLPVEYLYFKVIDNKDGSAQLEWSTASELNNAGFHVEKSVEGVNFGPIGFVEGAGNSSEVITYSFVDSYFNQSTYYRLKQVDFDGAFEFSDVVFLPSRESSFTKAVIYPNPVTDQITIGGMSEARYDMELIGLQGEIILSKVKVGKREAELYLNQQIPSLGSGLYILKLKLENQAQTLLFVKK